MNTNKEIHYYLKYLLVFLMISFSGFPYFTNAPNALLISLIMIFFLFSKIILKRIDNKKIYQLFFVLIIIFIGQSIQFSFFDVRSLGTLLIRFLLALIIALLVGNELPKIYVNLLKVISIISLVFFLTIYIFPSFENILLFHIAPIFNQESSSSFYKYTPNIIVFTLNIYDSSIGLLRNPGPFWEAGGFACFLIPAIIFNSLLNEKILNRTNLLFLLTLFTTFSTAAYLSIFVYAIFVIIPIVNRKSIILLPIIFSLFFFAGSYAYRVPFVSERIDRTIIYLAYPKESMYLKRDRAISAIVDFNDIKNYPIFGRGRGENRYDKNNDFTDFEHRNNGVTDFFVKFGLIFGIIYFRGIYKSLQNLALLFKRKPNFIIASFLAIIIMGLTQIIFMQTFFITLSVLYIFINVNNDLNRSNLT